MNLRKKGFTLVELVIVIAVVAILAAVLIPTFTSLINKANMSSDQVAVRDMNTILALEKVENEKMDFDAVIEALEKAGFRAENYRPLTEGATFYWIEDLKIIVLADENNKILYPTNIDEDIEYSEEKWHSLSEVTEELDPEKCNHPYESLENVSWYSTGTKIFKPSCIEEGIVKTAYCKKCSKNVSMVSVEPTGHDNEDYVEDYEIDGVVYDEVRFEASYCKKCDSPVAFVEPLAYSMSGTEYAWDVSYSFKPFSTKDLTVVLNGEEKIIPTSIFTLMYGGKLNEAKQAFNSQDYSKLDELTKKVFGFEVNDSGEVVNLGATKYFEKGVTFSVGFNTAVKADQYIVGGYYENFGAALDVNGLDINAYEDYVIEILADFVSYGPGKTHSVLETVVEFICGFSNLNMEIADNQSRYATVKLVIEDNEGEYKVISIFKYEITKPYANNALNEYKSLNLDTNDIYKVVAENGQVYYGTNGMIYDEKFLKAKFTAAKFNDDGTVEYNNAIFVADIADISGGNENIKIYKMNPQQ